MLHDKLKSHNKIPFHMPGHKRNIDILGEDLPYSIDITEIDGFDNLYEPDGVIKNIEDKIKKLYHSDNSFLLINGTTCGILAGIYSVLKAGDKVLVARNCHKSVYNALKIVNADPIYLKPDLDEYGIAKGFSATDIKNVIDSNDIRLIILTSPTYEGVKSDVDSICNIAHSKNIPVLIDSAHGAHFFDNTEADIVVMSLHKTLPALTQCAVAHVNSSLVDPELFRINLSIFESSSPSYVLMSSIEQCVEFIFKYKNLFRDYEKKLQDFYLELSSLKHIKILRYNDPGKIIIFTGSSNLSSIELSDVLREKYNIEVEMVSRDYILAMSTVCDKSEHLDALCKALIEIDSTLTESEYTPLPELKIPHKKYNSHHITAKGKLTPIGECVNKISHEYVWMYPPGIPLIIPGEVISKELIDYLETVQINGIQIHSTYNKLSFGIYCNE